MLLPNPSLRRLSYDVEFPDLYIMNMRSTNELFRDYLGKKIRRMGYRPEDLSRIEPNSATPTNEYGEEPIDYSNTVFHRGKTWDVSVMSPTERLSLAQNLTYDQLKKYDNLECIRAENHISTPSKKLQYPEPFIASASFTHTDIGFIHVLHYQYWLWFFFIFLIVFFFLTFLSTARWCNMRVRPRRETRGVSRSKCGDLITACVPVSWAITIIVTESTDASDFYDGFGAAELTLGVRAYQWGWEYYYPKNLDLNYNLKPSYSSYVGKSLRYSSSPELSLSKNDLWRFYQNKTISNSLTPAHLLLLPTDKKKVISFLNLEDVGLDSLKESSAFKKIKVNSKAPYATLTPNLETSPLRVSESAGSFLGDTSFTKAGVYGLERQHSYLNLKAQGGTLPPFLDSNSFKKFLTVNSNYSDLPNQRTGFSNVPFFQHSTPWLEGRSNSSPALLDGFSPRHSSASLFPSLKSHLGDLNNDSDKDFLNYPNRKFFNETLFSKSLAGIDSTKTLGSGDFLDVNPGHTLGLFTLARPSSSKFLTLQSSNNNFLPADQNVRQYQGLLPATKSLNYSSPFLDSTSENSLSTSLFKNFNDLGLRGAEGDQLYPLLSNKVFFEAPYSPNFSTLSSVDSLNVDTSSLRSSKLNNLNGDFVQSHDYLRTDDISLLRGKRDGAPKFLSTTYWKQFWAQTSPELRLAGLSHSLTLKGQSSLPTFSGYYDYDFRNIQAYELLEDLFWETTCPSYSHNDYLEISDSRSGAANLNLRETLRFPLFTKENVNVDQVSRALPRFSSKLKPLSYANGLFFDELSQTSALTSTPNYEVLTLTNNLFNLEESYEGWLGTKALFLENLNFTFLANTPSTPVLHFSTPLNAFRADYEDFSWFTPLSAKLKSENVTLLEGGSSQIPTSFEERLTNPTALRRTARNSSVTFNALQKVFRARFEEGRSHATLAQFAELGLAQPFLNGPRVPYESLLGKTKESFFKANFYATKRLNQLNPLLESYLALNYQFFDFPFLLAAKSDMGRYMWFDWFAKWGLVEAQSSSVSRYSTLGVPYLKKPFDYNVESGEGLLETETYLTRISRARKNYLPNWTYTPYVYARSSSWNNSSTVWVANSTSVNSYSWLRFLLTKAESFGSTTNFSDNTSKVFTPTSSGMNTYAKNSWRPLSSVQSYYFTLSSLSDLLTKRELMLRQYLEINGNVLSLPYELSASPRNPLFKEVEASFNFNDPLSFQSEASREVLFSSLNFFRFTLLKEWLLLTKESFINLSLVNNYLFFYLFGYKTSQTPTDNNELLKNPSRPLRKGVSSMLRLHATGAIAMPIEVRLQILASSRDVIHSWSIPSAGIKIDCVPGYTSHKIMIFLMEGIYWGQCMEICGRYHHWMPIVVYFMRRDLFFLWCTHFIFNTSLTKTWDINDRQYSDYIRFVSYDKASWLNEFN